MRMKFSVRPPKLSVNLSNSAAQPGLSGQLSQLRSAGRQPLKLISLPDHSKEPPEEVVKNYGDNDIMKRFAFLSALLIFVLLFAACSVSSSGSAAGQGEISARAALEKLYAATPGAVELGSAAKAILVFPEITKAGLVVGGQYGKGVLFKDGAVEGYYSSTGASYGLQAGVQQFGYALFFMSNEDLKYLSESNGWEVGVGPTITVVDKGFANSITTTTARKGVYVFFFDQKGLMAGLGIQGTKISKLVGDN